MDPPKPSRKPREAPQPTDLDEKLTALRRRTAAQTRPRERAEREKTDRMPSTSTQTLVQQHSPRKHAPQPNLLARPSQQDADHEDFSRRLKISSSPSPRPAHAQPAHKSANASKLFNPDTDPIPMRRTAEPDIMSDGTGSSHVKAAPPQPTHREERPSAARQLFDHRKDDPVRFSVMTRAPNGRPMPTAKASGDYVSASSTSSYANSISSAFTLSSTTDGSSTSSALFEGRPKTEDSGNNVYSVQLKKLYRTITNLEIKIKQEDSVEEADDAMNSRTLPKSIKGKELETDDHEREKWKKQINDHKELVEVIHNLLRLSLAPAAPTSLSNIPTKYNIIVRLWTFAFHKLLESLRRASFSSPLALEHLQDFIYYAYSFYTGLLEEQTLSSFKSGWLEALGDLARYRMAVAAMVNGGLSSQSGLTSKAVSDLPNSTRAIGNPNSNGSNKSISNFPAPARIDDSPSPSIGIAAARLLEVEPEKERWRNIARDWYAEGLSEQPGTGKLHHHLGLLSREVESEELRGVYHFVKSMTTLHPFPTSRESVLPIWSHAAQMRRSAPDAHASELFVLLHGMLFTNIQMDDFSPTLARFVERLSIEGAEAREWTMMAVINISSILEYGRPNGVLKRLGCIGSRDATGPQAAAAMRVMAKKVAAGVPGAHVDDERMDVDEDGVPAAESHETMNAADYSASFASALQLAFAMLSHVLRHPTRKATPYARSELNPYLTVMLTFLSTLLKHRAAVDALARSMPWADLAAFFATIPRKIMIDQGLMAAPGKPAPPAPQPGTERWLMLTSGCPPPLPEDWCLRGMEWVGRKVYERGFWKSGEDRKPELEVLEASESTELTDGTIEDDDGDDSRGSSEAGGANAEVKPKVNAGSDLVRRWVRITRCAVNISGEVEGFTWVPGTRDWRVEGRLAEKVALWKEEDRVQQLEEERRRMGKRWVDDGMDVDGEDVEASEGSEDDENDSEEIKVLKARRRYLKSLLQSAGQSVSPVRKARGPRSARRSAEDGRPQLCIVPGYTILVVDTNILLSSLSVVASLIESQKWTVVVPLPVVMELDGLSTNLSPQLGEAAEAALAYVAGHVRSHSTSLKVQTSRGNYLASLNVRTEEVDFHDGNPEKSMDDLILKAAIWQDEHWVDRSAMLKAPAVTPAETQNAVKVVLLSLDRNLRLKSRSRQLPAAGEKDLAAILAIAT
ncbi:hypothetical protein D9619_005946 [Psilocybe cf. subviscida]|uniref:PIN domain-containing protein n=1 Tax=Psilocybe cf. subviscida TaxID=2480587 RepID=A0A8H5FBC6_9AGAR|nr:hypothetical protein D9619_005946 [Psilocybe cf. subviscida]